jgi:hypothetical protein
MQYQDLIRHQVKRHGPKALLFAAERNEVLRPSTFDSVELQYMNEISEEQLLKLLSNVYQRSQTFLTTFLETPSHTSSRLSSKTAAKKTAVKHKDGP